METEQVAQSAFGVLLRHHRVAAGLSQEMLAERALMSVNGISALERGERRSPYRETVELLSRALRLTPAAAAEFEAAAARPRRRRERALSHGAASDGGGGTEPATNLPSSRTSLVGREAQIADIVGFLQDSRLVTVTGAGGVGKTRTALAVGESFFADMKAAVWFVELAPVAQGSLVPGAVAEVLNLQESTNRPLLESLVAYLKRKSLLLIFDNCEHVIAEAAAVADALLRGCPQLRILATSREPLHIAGEQAYRLPSLPTPDPEAPGMSAAEAADYAAVVLFAQRAHAIDHGFTLTDDNAPIVAEICRRLDGIPLAIELAAGRVNLLPVEALSRNLDQRFRILTGGDRTALPRQQTMRALIDWSYDLLARPEQRMFERLSIFVGGWTLEAAAAIYTDEDAVSDEFGALDLLTSLVDKSLAVSKLNSPEPRYKLFESSREYAREKLRARKEQWLIARRHAEYYCGHAEIAAATWNEIEISSWLAQLAPDLDNFRAAFASIMTTADDDSHLAARLIRALCIPFLRLGLHGYGARLAEAVLATNRRNLESDLEADVRSALARFYLVTGPLNAALSEAEQAARLYMELGDRRNTANVLLTYGMSAHWLGDRDDAVRAYSNALKIARDLNDLHLTARLLWRQGHLALDLKTRDALFTEAAAIFKGLGDERGWSSVLDGLAGNAYLRGDIAEALTCARGVLEAIEGLSDKTNAASVLTDIAGYYAALGQMDECYLAAREALMRARNVGASALVACAIQHLAAVSASRGDIHKAARLLGASDGQLSAHGRSRGPVEASFRERICAALREKIGDCERFDALLMEGRAWSMERSIQEAIRV